MGKHGINAPPGMPIKKIEDLLPAAKKMADSDGEVCRTNVPFAEVSLLACMQSTILHIATNVRMPSET